MRYSMTTQFNSETHCMGPHLATDTFSVKRERERQQLPFPRITLLTCLSPNLGLWDFDTPFPPSTLTTTQRWTDNTALSPPWCPQWSIHSLSLALQPSPETNPDGPFPVEFSHTHISDSINTRRSLLHIFALYAHCTHTNFYNREIISTIWHSIKDRFFYVRNRMLTRYHGLNNLVTGTTSFFHNSTLSLI